jgi:hypothetical protein
MRRTLALVVALLALSALAMAAPVIYPIGQASTSGFSNGAFAGQSPRGWDFTITQPITVVELGVNAGDSIPITLTLWDVTTQTLLTQTVANSSAFSWVFASITPLTLSVGDTYSVIGWADTTGSGIPWYIFNNNPPSAFNPTGVVNYLNTRFDNGIGPNTFPLGVLGAPAQYGVTDIGYQPATPEPATLALLGSAVGLASMIRRRLGL